MQDGKVNNLNADLKGGLYDSGNNIKFSFPTAYTVTLLSWTVIEYHEKYADIGELEHVKDIIKWGSDYLLKVFVPPNSTTDSAILYSQASILKFIYKYILFVLFILHKNTQRKYLSSLLHFRLEVLVMILRSAAISLAGRDLKT